MTASGPRVQPIDRDMICGRCHERTRNPSQGHYWAFCKVTGACGVFHFCCPGDCELNAGR